MRGSWDGAIRIDGDVSQLADVGSWLITSLAKWPSETLVWLTADRAVPTWVEAVVLLEEADQRAREERMRQPAKTSVTLESVDEKPARLALDLAGIRRWRQDVREAATENRDLDVWNHSARLGGENVSVQVHGSDDGGRWSGFTLATFADVNTSGSLDGGSVPKDRWVRFDPQASEPCDSWNVILSNGLIVRIEVKDEQSTSVHFERRDLTDPEGLDQELGRFLVRSTDGRLDLAIRDLPFGQSTWSFLDPELSRRPATGNSGGALKSLDCLMEWDSAKPDKLRLAARWAVAPRPRLWNLLTPFWPIARAITKRKAKKAMVLNSTR